MLEFILLICGLAGLWVGAEILINAAISLAARYKVSDALIGMLILAIGTDIPELLVAVDASLGSLAGVDLSGIVIGTAIGSSIGQFGLVIGVVGFFGLSRRPLELALGNAAFLSGGLLLLAVFFFDGLVSSREGWALVLLYCAYLFTVLYRKKAYAEQDNDAPKEHLLKTLFFLVLGLTLLPLAAQLTVISATDFAETIGLSNLSVSAILIGLGSSLPELSVAIIAMLKNRSALSIGNLMGSNVLDTLLVPGVAATISPIVVPTTALLFDLPVLALMTALVIGFLYVSPRGVKKTEASILLLIYVTYAFVRMVAD
ncbi:MAG: cation:H+ antiporter [Paraglaciecola sp.]|jgi:cation:H+ antiporter